MPRYALVEFSTMAVVNVATSASASASSVPTAPPGFRNIIENASSPTLSEWTPGDDPVVGDIWDGAIPAGFAPPAPEPVGNLPSNMIEAFADIAVAREALDLAMARAAALVPTTA